MARALVDPDEAWRAVMITADEVLADPAASDWLKRSLLSALKRDPVDAISDAEALLLVLRRRVAAIQYPDGHVFDPVTQHGPDPEWQDNHSSRTICLR
jgi:hypothetical protein